MSTEYKNIKALLREEYKTYRALSNRYKNALKLLDKLTGVKRTKTKPVDKDRIRREFTGLMKGAL
jgi:hypothetical protein